MNQFIPGRGPITNNTLGDVILDKLTSWGGSLDNLALSEIRREMISLTSQDDINPPRTICRLVSYETIPL